MAEYLVRVLEAAPPAGGPQADVDLLRRLDEAIPNVEWAGQLHVTHLLREARARIAQMTQECESLDRQIERMALCPDHRDKGVGRCIVCQAAARAPLLALVERAAHQVQIVKVNNGWGDLHAANLAISLAPILADLEAALRR